MKVINNENDFTIFVTNKEIGNKDNLKDDIKKLLIKLKQKYKLSMSGFYKANVYLNKKLSIIDFVKEDDLDFFKDIIDLDVNVYEDAVIYLKFKDIFITNKFDNIYYYKNNYYINICDVSDKEFYKVIEHTLYVYGKQLEQIKNKLNLVVKSI